MLKKLNIGTVTFIITLLLSLFLVACQRQTDGRVQEESQTMGHVLSGSAASPVRMEVFSDMQCPACRELFLRTILPLINDYGDDINIVYHEFPLNMHRHSRPASRYIAAAAKLGRQRLLSVYEAIYNDQSYWASTGRLEDSVAEALSREDFLRVRQILQDEDSLAVINEAIENEVRLGISKGVNSTPTVFISHGGSEQKIESWPSYELMRRFLDPILK
jgi:protein-disulfide isomerase